MTRSRILSVSLSLVLSAVLLVILLRRVGSGNVVQILARIHGPALLLYVAVSLVSAGLRALRFRWLLRPQRIGWGNVLLVTFVRNAFEDLLPARLGSLSYIYVLTERLGFSFDAAASTFLVAIVFDFLTLGPFIALAVVSLGSGGAGFSAGLLAGLAVAFSAAFALILWKIVPLAGLGIRAFEKAAAAFGWAEKKFVVAGSIKLRATRESLAAIQGRKIAVPLFGLSALIRLGKYISIFALLAALLHSQGIRPADLSFGKTVLAVTGAEMTSAFPVKGLADFGTWESAWALAFRLMHFDPRLAVLSGIGIHLVTNLFEYGLGLSALLILLWPFRRRAIASSGGT